MFHHSSDWSVNGGPHGVEMRINLEVHNELSEPCGRGAAAGTRPGGNLPVPALPAARRGCGAGRDAGQLGLGQPGAKGSVYGHGHLQRHRRFNALS